LLSHASFFSFSEIPIEQSELVHGLEPHDVALKPIPRLDFVKPFELENRVLAADLSCVGDNGNDADRPALEVAGTFFEKPAYFP
jgi:hypothetical protein